MMGEYNIIRLEIPCSVKFVGVARRAVEGIASTLSLTNEQLEDLKIAVGEACSNAIKFSSPDTRSVQITYRVTNDTLEIEVCNKGQAFNHEKIKKQLDVEKMPVGGMGLYLINKVMDDLDINSESGRTTLKMTKRIGC